MKRVLFLSFLIASIFSVNAMATVAYIVDKTELKNQKEELMATLTKGTKVEVLASKGSLSKVKISGWSYEEEPNQEIYYDIGLTVELALIEENMLKLRKIGVKKPDVNQDVWFKNSITGWVETTMLKKNFRSLWKDEIIFTTARCGACHSEPKISDYRVMEFPGLINAMKDTAGMSEEEEISLVNYYQKNKIYGLAK